jgi:hypothetical protein
MIARWLLTAARGLLDDSFIILDVVLEGFLEKLFLPCLKLERTRSCVLSKLCWALRKAAAGTVSSAISGERPTRSIYGVAP